MNHHFVSQGTTLGSTSVTIRNYNFRNYNCCCSWLCHQLLWHIRKFIR